MGDQQIELINVPEGRREELLNAAHCMWATKVIYSSYNKEIMFVWHRDDGRSLTIKWWGIDFNPTMLGVILTTSA